MTARLRAMKRLRRLGVVLAAIVVMFLAFALVVAAGASPRDVLRALAKLEGVPGRLELEG